MTRTGESWIRVKLACEVFVFSGFFFTNISHFCDLSSNLVDMKIDFGNVQIFLAHTYLNIIDSAKNDF